MIVPPDHVRNTHVHVIHHDTEVISRRAIRTRDDQIIQLTILESDGPMYQVLYDHRTFQWVTEAHHGIDSGTRCAAAATYAAVTGLLFPRKLLCAQLLELLLGAVTVVCRALLQHRAQHFPVPRKP